MATRLEKHTSQEDMDRAARLSEFLGNLPPMSSMGCSGSARRYRAPSSTLPTTSSRGKTTTPPEPVAEVDASVVERVEKESGERRRSLTRRRSVFEGLSSPSRVAMEKSSAVRLPVVKRRRVPARRTRATGVAAAGQ